jgi:hypothetical protein
VVEGVVTEVHSSHIGHYHVIFNFLKAVGAVMMVVLVAIKEVIIIAIQIRNTNRQLANSREADPDLSNLS